ncbi:S8 family serine peptidase [Defluviimonas sp. WL0024]|uniref:S8 family serine peptidase n=1 Tax=Albidovulum salinarum TaxID=2984153 RepID=A0ABT2WY54_9RHOB|nr:S8 family peptidase [Defluviimonas sp. WL0024]MCU9846608.1 S8 family serine peptidase [Defluviimonas sp. WL0024]
MAERLHCCIRASLAKRLRPGRKETPCRPVLFLGIGAVLVLTACKGGESAATLPIPVPGGAGTLGSYFVQSFEPYEAAAAALRDTTARYLFQKNEWRFSAVPGPTFSSYPLASARTEYAHAVGLTGAGQTISIVDEGFRQTHDTIAGRTVATSGALPVADHGTAVASVAAGSSSRMIGVAPGANLALGSSGSASSVTAATRTALRLGAVAQNNSWGFPVPATAESFNTVFGTSDGAAYLAALDAYAARGVVVFALSNDKAATTSELMEGLPALRPSLETGWLAVGNATPAFDAASVQSAQMQSASCLNAARWCLVADGSWNAATAASNSSYGFTVGSSFAAPQVAGALAILAEAFPNLTPHQLRLRLLASADNGFFAPDGSVELVPGFVHGYSDVYGHGFLDVRAALLPIGTTSMSLPGGVEVKTTGPVIVAGAAIGDAVERSLGVIEVEVTDSLAGGFRMPAGALTASSVPRPMAEGLLARATSDDLSARRAAAAQALTEPFRAFNGRTLDFTSPDGSLSGALLIPASGDADAGYGISAKHALIDGPVGLDIGVKIAHDRGALGLGAADDGLPASDLVALQLGLTGESASGGFISLSCETGIADLGAPAYLSGVSAARFSSLDLDLGQREVFASGDRLSFRASLPMAVTSGRAEMVLPVVRSAGRSAFEPVALDLAPSERQVDLAISYQRPLAPGLEFLAELAYAENYGNRAGVSDTAGVLAITFSF